VPALLGNHMGLPLQAIAPMPLNQRVNLIPILILLSGIGIGLLVTALLLLFWLTPSTAELQSIVGELSLSSLFTLTLGSIIYYYLARSSTSLSFSLAFASIWAAVISIFNVWLVARTSFFVPYDVTLGIILLIFAAIIASTFGLSVTWRVSRDLGELAENAQRLAEGDLGARAMVRGHDEMARTAVAFNHMASQLQTAATQRDEVENLRRDLIAWTSHDLRTPLTSIRAMIEALHDGLITDSATQQRYYQTIRNDIVALNILLDDLFELAQLDAGGMTLEKMNHALSDLISDTLESFHLLAMQKNIQLQGNVAPDIDPVPLNAAKIGRVLANLVHNALRHTPAGGQVVVTAVRQPTHIQVSVQDSGPGFRPEDLPRVFEKFYRGEEARSRATGGSGLGLAIAAGIIAAHGGDITAANLPQGGAILTFTLPLN
jgi:signal transduction histidine kinase